MALQQLPKPPSHHLWANSANLGSQERPRNFRNAVMLPLWPKRAPVKSSVDQSVIHLDMAPYNAVGPKRRNMATA